MDPRLRTLLRQGERAARLGKAQAAEAVYRQAVDEFPGSAEAWLGLSQVAALPEERQSSYQRALELDPSLAVDAADDAHPADPPADPLEAALASSQLWLEQSTRAAEESVSRPVVAPVVAPPAETAPVPHPEPVGEMVACFYHPNTPTGLRCNRCDKPICQKCAVRTPVGYRCKSCISEQQDVFYSALWYDYLLAAIVSLPLAALASYIIYSIGWLTIFVAPFAGIVIAEAVRLVTRRRRGRWLPVVVGVCIVLGSLPGVAIWLVGSLRFYAAVGARGLPLMDLIWQGVYLVLAVSSASYRVK